MIDVAADVAALTGPMGEFSQAFTLWPEGPAPMVVYGILQRDSVTGNPAGSATDTTANRRRAHIPTAQLAGVKVNAELLGPDPDAPGTLVRYRILSLRPTPYHMTELILRLAPPL